MAFYQYKSGDWAFVKQFAVGQQLPGSRSRYGPGDAVGERALQIGEIELCRPARRTVQVTEPGTCLADRETQGVAIAVQVDSQQLLRVSGGRALFPNRLARSRPINPTPLGHRADEGFPRAPDEAECATRLIADHGGPDVAGQRLRERRGNGVAQ